MHSRLYIKIMNSAAWREARNRAMSMQPLCVMCLERGFVTAARCVHHIIPVESARGEREAWDLALRPANLQPLCFDCHSEHHKRERSHSRTAHQQRATERLEQWKSRHGVKQQGNPPRGFFSERREDSQIHLPLHEPKC